MSHACIVPLDRSMHRQDLVYLDFQGDFDTSDVNVKGIKLGDLEMHQDHAVLVMGHQRIEGKKVRLAKPVAAIHRREGDGAVYDVVAILREKYVFTGRPSLVVRESLRGLTKIGG